MCAKKIFAAEKPANDNDKAVVTRVTQPKTDEEKLFQEYIRLTSGQK